MQEFIPGQTLDKELRQKGRYTEAEVQTVLVSLLSVLKFVHEKGVIHRDLKPENIMRHTDGKLFLIDFGISKELGLSLRTQVGTKAGTPGYMPYEQWEERKATPANDLYAIGAIAFYLVTGVEPRVAAATEANDPYNWTRRWKSFLPSELVLSEKLRHILDQLLQKDYQDRYQSAEDALKDLGIVSSTANFDQSVIFAPSSSTFSTDQFSTTVASQNVIEDWNGISLEMIYIPKGRFQMGSPEGVGFDNEYPQHWVDVPPFYMGKTPITQLQYQAVMDNNPSHFQGKNLPVERVSWHDANQFCQKLSDKTGKQYRLPSEAEWEYACRANTQTLYSFGDDPTKLGEYAWYANISGDQPIDALQIWQSDRENYWSRIYEKNKCRTHPVREKKPNPWGLYDMHGNVWEWCQDHWHENYTGSPHNGSAWIDKNNNDKNSFRLLRGGSWSYYSGNCRSAIRGGGNADDQYNVVGFRVVGVFS